MARDPEIYCEVFRALLKRPITLSIVSPPEPLVNRLKIIVSKDFDRSTQAGSSLEGKPPTSANEVFELFLHKLETSLGVKGEYVVLESSWEETKSEFKKSHPDLPPSELGGDMGGEFGDVSTFAKISPVGHDSVIVTSVS